MELKINQMYILQNLLIYKICQNTKNLMHLGSEQEGGKAESKAAWKETEFS